MNPPDNLEQATRHSLSTPLNEAWLYSRLLLLGLFIIGTVIIYNAHALESQTIGHVPALHSGIPGYCLDVWYNGTSPNTIVDSWGCNASPAQAWQITYDHITHDGHYCLGVQSDAKLPGSPIVLNTCNDSPGQVWLREQSDFFNPNSGLCLSTQPNQSTGQLVLEPCAWRNRVGEHWDASGIPLVSCTGLAQGDAIACNAVKEWSTWQTKTAAHNALLAAYTDGSPTEEWCADFVSYVYKESGYPFTNGAVDGWNESDANAIQDMGFTVHDPSKYTPKPGDVAYFNYNGGHVEIVVSGGPHPTFIYGDSATTDPVSNNGNMEANTIINSGTEGKLVYYLSPN